MSITYLPGGRHEDMASRLAPLLDMDVEYKEPGFVERYGGKEGVFAFPQGASLDQIKKAVGDAGLTGIAPIEGNVADGYSMDAKSVTEKTPAYLLSALLGVGVTYKAQGFFGMRLPGENKGTLEFAPGAKREQIEAAMKAKGLNIPVEEHTLGGLYVDTAKVVALMTPKQELQADNAAPAPEPTKQPPVKPDAKKKPDTHAKANEEHKGGRQKLKQQHSSAAGDELDLDKINFKAFGINPHDKKAVRELTETLQSMRVSNQVVVAELKGAAGYAGQASVAAGQAASKLDHASKVLKPGCTL